MPRSENQLQLPIFSDYPSTQAIVNVASVPQRSPFRYPGGKTWLVPIIRQWFSSLSFKPELFLEPFAGGAIVGLTAAFENLADKIVLVELDDQIAAVWRAILGKDAEWLAQRILSFDLTIENVQKELNNKPATINEKAFQTILKNRTFHGGILAPGSGFIKYGENGNGIRSRWYPETLANRIRKIEKIKDRITFIEGNGLEAIQTYSSFNKSAMFIDPPYTAAGKKAGTRLYSYYQLDHDKLFRLAAKAKGPVLLTYDNDPEIENLAIRHGFKFHPIAMKNTHHAKMMELLISRDLCWLV